MTTTEACSGPSSMSSAKRKRTDLRKQNNSAASRHDWYELCKCALTGVRTAARTHFESISQVKLGWTEAVEGIAGSEKNMMSFAEAPSKSFTKGSARMAVQSSSEMRDMPMIALL